MSSWPLGSESAAPELGDAELFAIQALGAAVPTLTLLSLLIFVVFTLLLVFKTKAAGRWWVLSGVTILFGFGAYQMFQWNTGAMLAPGLLESLLARFIPLLGIFVTTVGYARLVWGLRKNANPPLEPTR